MKLELPHDTALRMLTGIAKAVGIEPPIPGESTLFFERYVVETVAANAKLAAHYRELEGPLKKIVNGGR